MRNTLRLVVLVLVVAASASAKGKNDCLVTLSGPTPTKPGGSVVVCEDGAACDADALVNDQCTFEVAICVHQDDVPGCVSPTIQALKAGGAGFTLPPTLPTLPAEAPACGQAGVLELPLNGKKKSKAARIRITATADGKPRHDTDKLTFRCLRGAEAQCPANPQGGPSEVRFRVRLQGGDLDIGTSGAAHDSQVTGGAIFRMCLGGCDEAGSTTCVEDEAGTTAVNRLDFSPPLPLLASGVATCVRNRYDLAKGKVIGGSSNVLTGETAVTINLSSEVRVTSAAAICPECSGNGIGQRGSCVGGARPGARCTTEGQSTVGGRLYNLSTECPAAGQPVGAIPLTLPLNTTASSIDGAKPCPGQGVDFNPGARQGSVTAPSGSYPKSAPQTQVAVFCIGDSGSTVVNGVTGLPGPGALVLPLDGCWLRTGDDVGACVVP